MLYKEALELVNQDRGVLAPPERTESYVTLCVGKSGWKLVHHHRFDGVVVCARVERNHRSVAFLCARERRAGVW